ncbi:hypothetical protein F1559_003329 [Cyanidiococcus yangmingshanensis]|uniref:Uncharacterized protein n=1 Tax=Cyanidiococcus yangmingshanensis TaxID=2690220 RepID=A0A7J7INP3_9RHOD|nr:hypothetical protein F1559_003329 [Cyanidiococcus yangmingshanensis]
MERRTLMQDEKERLLLQLADIRSRESRVAEARKQLVQLRAAALMERLCGETTLCQSSLSGQAHQEPRLDAGGSYRWFWWPRRRQQQQQRQKNEQQRNEALQERAENAAVASSLSGDDAISKQRSLALDKESLPWLPVLLDWYEQIERDAPDWATHMMKRSPGESPERGTQSTKIMI